MEMEGLFGADSTAHVGWRGEVAAAGGYVVTHRDGVNVVRAPDHHPFIFLFCDVPSGPDQVYLAATSREVNTPVAVDCKDAGT